MAERAPRDSREDDSRPQPWRPASTLPEPPDLPGYKFRWLRVAVLGQVDNATMSGARREGWELVRPEDMPELAADIGCERKDMIETGGLALAKTTVANWLAMREYFQNKSDNSMSIVENDLMKVQDPRLTPYKQTKTTVSKTLR